MPAPICERWEYWEPDPEIAYAMSNGEARGLELVPLTECPRTGSSRLDGFRLSSNPRHDPTRLGPPKPDRPDRLPLRRCGWCPKRFTPDYRGRVYCSADCLASAVAARRGSPARLDWDEIADRFAAGGRVTDVAAELGTNRAAVRYALRCRGVYEPRKCGPARTVPDRACKNPACRKTFRPHQVRCGVYCSRPCMLAAKGAVRIDPAAVLALHAAGRNVCQIARELGASEGGVRGVLARHRQRAG